MNERLWQLILSSIVQLGTAGLGIWGALQAWKMHNDRKLEETKVKARESNAGQTAVTELKEDIKALYKASEAIEERCEARHKSIYDQLGKMNESMLQAIVNLKR